jgi:Zn-finger nucleic acid-binding protein
MNGATLLKEGRPMQCPIDGSELVMTDRQGVEIDYCPKCRGVWLDRGELDKIIEKTAPQVPQRPAHSDRGGEASPRYEPRRDDRSDQYEQRYEERPRKKKSLLGELFDF